MICPTCGTENPSRRRRCRFCGSLLTNDAQIFSAESIPANSAIARVQVADQVQANPGILDVPLDVGEEIIKEYRPAEEYVSKKFKIAVATYVIMGMGPTLALLVIAYLEGGLGNLTALITSVLIFPIYVITPLVSSAFFLRRMRNTRYWITSRRVIITDSRKKWKIREFRVNSIERIIVSGRRQNQKFPTVTFVLKRNSPATSRAELSDSAFPGESSQYSSEYKGFISEDSRPKLVTSFSSYRSRSFFWIKKEDADGIKQLMENLKTDSSSVR